MVGKIMTGLSKNQETILFDLLEKMCGYYRVILELSRSENRKFLIVAPMSELISLMKRRRVLHSCIEDLRADLEPLRSIWDKQKEKPAKIKERVKELLQKIKKNIEESIELDRLNQKMLEKRIQVLASEQSKLEEESKT